MTDHQLMQQALEALEWEWGGEPMGSLTWKAITDLRERLAHCDRCGKKLGGEGDIHTCTPPQRPWVGLTDDEFDSINPKLSLFQFYKAIEAALKEKNTWAD